MANTRITKPTRIIVISLVGVALGASASTFDFAEGNSYLSDVPETCVNCHVMRPQYNSWERSRHHAVATCNDCHVPSDGLNKWIAKSANGWHHSKAFTLGDYPENIRIKPNNLAIVEANCIRCHGSLFHHATTTSASAVAADGCVRCHAGVAHAAEHTMVPR